MDDVDMRQAAGEWCSPTATSEDSNVWIIGDQADFVGTHGARYRDGRGSQLQPVHRSDWRPRSWRSPTATNENRNYSDGIAEEMLGHGGARPP
jgi:hypothetical protein